MTPSASSESPVTRIGIVGLSATRGWALGAHLPAIAASPHFTVTALSASSPASAQATAVSLGIPHACADARELVRHPEVDLVLVAVKVSEHREIVEAAITAGKDVLCEWPLGNGLAETEALTARAHAASVRGFVGLQARSSPPIRFLRDLIRSGEIGEIHSTTLIGSGDRWGPTVPAEVRYLIDASQGGTMLTIPVGHSLDALCQCLGELTEVSATLATRRSQVIREDTGESLVMTAADEIAVNGRLESGAVVSLHYSGGRAPYPGLVWRIRGTGGTIEVRGRTGHLQFGQLELLIGAEPDSTAPLVPLAVPDEYELAKVAPALPAYAVANAYALLAEDLARHTGEVPRFADAARRHRSLEAIERSASAGERIALT